MSYGNFIKHQAKAIKINKSRNS